MVHTEEIIAQTLDAAATKRRQSDLQLYVINQIDETIIETERLRGLDSSSFDTNIIKQISSLLYRRRFLQSQLDNLQNN
jgi:hypothetical protein